MNKKTKEGNKKVAKTDIETLTQSIAALRESQDDTTGEIKNLYSLFAGFIEFEKNRRLDNLEERFERKAPAPNPFTNQEKLSPKKDSSGLSIVPLFGLATALPLLAGAAVGLTASILGLDDAIKSARVVPNLMQFSTNIVRIARATVKLTTDTIDAFRDAVNLVSGFVGRLTKFLIRLSNLTLPELPTFSWGVERLYGVIKLPKLPQLRFVTATGDVVGDFINMTIKAPIARFVDSIGDVVNIIKLRLPDLPRIPELTIPASWKAFKLPDIPIPRLNIPKVIDITVDTAKWTARATSFIFGIVSRTLSQVVKVFPFLRVAGKIGRFIFGPITQAIITLIDGVVGFFKGWRESEETTFIGKLKDGMFGAATGIIEGLTKAIDFLVATALPWALDQIGFTKVADWLRDNFNLTQFVQPMMDLVRAAFAFFFNPAARAEMLNEWSEKYSIKRIFEETLQKVQQWFTELFDFLPSLEDVKNKLRFWVEEERPAPDDIVEAAQGTDVSPEVRAQIADMQMRREDALKNIERYKAARDAGDFSNQANLKDENLRLKGLEDAIQMIAEQHGIIPEFSTGTPFKDFGAGTLVKLHGSEAVVPEKSPQGRVLTHIERILTASTPSSPAIAKLSDEQGYPSWSLPIATERFTPQSKVQLNTKTTAADKLQQLHTMNSILKTQSQTAMTMRLANVVNRTSSAVTNIQHGNVFAGGSVSNPYRRETYGFDEF